MNVDDVEAEIEIFAEIAGARLGFEVAVGGRDQADIDLDRLRAADAIDLAFLNRAQQFRLEARMHLADFVEQQGAAMRFLEFADAAGDGAGERAFLVAEQFAFEQIFRDRGAIDRDERCLGALALAVDVAREHFLTRAALAGDEDRSLGGRDLLGETHDALHRRIAIDERVAVGRDRLQHRGDQLGIRGEGDVFLGAGLDRAYGRVGVVADAASDDRNEDTLLLQAFDHPRDVELHIHHQQIGTLAGAQRAEAVVDIVGMGDGRAAIERDLAGGAEMAVERAENQETHDTFPLNDAD